MKHHEFDHLARDAAMSKGRTFGVAALSLFCVSPAAIAADWEVLPQISVGAYVNDNYTLAPDTVVPVEVEGAQIHAELGLRATTQLTEFSLTPRIESTIFPDDEEWDSDDFYLRLNWNHERERFMAGLRADYSDETTVKSELPSSDDDGGLGEPDGGDDGIVAVDNNRQKVQGQAESFVRTDGALHPARGRGAIRMPTMTRRARPGLPAIEDLSGAIGFAFATSPTSTLSARAIASNYERNIDSVETDSLGVQFDWTSRLSDSPSGMCASARRKWTCRRTCRGRQDSRFRNRL